MSTCTRVSSQISVWMTDRHLYFMHVHVEPALHSKVRVVRSTQAKFREGHKGPCRDARWGVEGCKDQRQSKSLLMGKKGGGQGIKDKGGRKKEVLTPDCTATLNVDTHAMNGKKKAYGTIIFQKRMHSDRKILLEEITEQTEKVQVH